MDSSVLRIISEITKNVDAAHAEVLSRNAAAAAADAAEEAPAGELRTTVLKAINKLQTGLLERETEVRLLLLATLCSEHLLLLGPPGTAKSELARRLSGLCGGAYFERLLTRFSVPEELFGPLSMRGLESDVYVRKIDGYLPTAEVAFIDEIFKANSAILNALLTLLNERLFDNGSERLPVPLLCLVGASNELPESEELDALYDRFLIRRQVAQVSNDQIASLARLAAGRSAAQAPEDEKVAEPPNDDEGGADSNQGEDGAQAASGLLPLEVLQGTLQQAKDRTHVPDVVIDLLTELRNHLQDKCEPPIYVSDRRFMKCVNLLQVAAFADGREEVNEWDCLLLEFAMGNRPDDSRKVAQYILDTIASDPGLQQSELLFLGLFGRACRILDSAGRDELEELRGEVDTLVEVLDSRHASLCLTLDGGFPELRSTLWQSEASTRQAVQRVTPQMTENRTRLQDLLRESMVLQSCIAGGHSAGVLQKLLPKRFKQYERGISDRT